MSEVTVAGTVIVLPGQMITSRGITLGGNLAGRAEPARGDHSLAGGRSSEAGILDPGYLDKISWVSNLAVEVILMTMIKTPIEIDQEALEAAAEVLGTKTKKDTVNAALKEVGQRLTRLRALAALGEMADRGDFDEFLGDKRAYRR